MSLKIANSTTPTPVSPSTAPLTADSTHDPSQSDDEVSRPSKAPRCNDDDEEDIETAHMPLSADMPPSPTTPLRGSRSNTPPPGMDTLVRLFPGRKTQLLETVLSRSGGDVLRAIQTLLYTPPSIGSTPPPLPLAPSNNHLSHSHENNNNTSANNRTTPEHHQNNNASINRTPPPNELRHHELLQEQAALRASAFAPLGPPGLARFAYPPPQAFMGLPYPPFLHPRPDYYSPLNLASHSPALHHTPPSPIREHSLSPSSPVDHDTE